MATEPRTPDGYRWAPSGAPPRRAAIAALARDPARALLVGGGAIVVVGAFLPWVVASLPSVGRIEIGGFTEPGDGAITLTLGVALIILGRSEAASTTRAAVIGSLPLVIAVMTLLVGIVALRHDQIVVQEYLNRSGTASIGPGLWLTFPGAVIAIAGGALVARRTVGRIGRSLRPEPGDVATVAGGLVGAGLGVVLGVALVEGVRSAGVAGASAGLLVFVVVFLGLGGAYGGGRLARRLTVPPSNGGR